LPLEIARHGISLQSSTGTAENGPGLVTRA
jgi:hypothetical protein